MNFIKFNTIFGAIILFIVVQVETVYGQHLRFYNSGSYRDRDYRVRYGYGSERYYLTYPNIIYYTSYPTRYQDHYVSWPTHSVAVRKPVQTATKSSATAKSSVPLTDRSGTVAATLGDNTIRRRRPAVVENRNYIDY